MTGATNFFFFFKAHTRSLVALWASAQHAVFDSRHWERAPLSHMGRESAVAFDHCLFSDIIYEPGEKGWTVTLSSVQLEKQQVENETFYLQPDVTLWLWWFLCVLPPFSFRNPTHFKHYLVWMWWACDQKQTNKKRVTCSSENTSCVQMLLSVPKCFLEEGNLWRENESLQLILFYCTGVWPLIAVTTPLKMLTFVCITSRYFTSKNLILTCNPWEILRWQLDKVLITCCLSGTNMHRTDSYMLSELLTCLPLLCWESHWWECGNPSPAWATWLCYANPSV